MNDMDKMYKIQEYARSLGVQIQDFKIDYDLQGQGMSFVPRIQMSGFIDFVYERKKPKEEDTLDALRYVVSGLETGDLTGWTDNCSWSETKRKPLGLVHVGNYGQD